ncbi:amino acid transporter permease protein [Citreicella sp. SE45]|nr:amino acid transporter permease protein [Citreicella sp. SE45]
MPVFTPDAPEVLAWLGSAANAQAIQGLSDGAAAQAAVAALTEANTPFLQSFSVLRFSFLELADIDEGATFFIGAALMLITFAIQHRGILGTARVQMWIGLLVVVPMLIVGIVPFFNGNVNRDNYVPLVPPTGE